MLSMLSIAATRCDYRAMFYWIHLESKQVEIYQEWSGLKPTDNVCFRAAPKFTDYSKDDLFLD